MRKKSHISLAKFIVEQSDAVMLHHHRRAFYLGNILPDCKLSFLTERHEFYGTFEKIADNIRSLTENCDRPAPDTMAYWRHLGEIIHYIADYFTFPHSRIYTGTLREHCAYEKKLRDYLREYIASGEAALQKIGDRIFENVESLLEFIRSSHEEYIKGPHGVEDDARHIIQLCGQVIMGVLQLLSRRACQENPVFDGSASAC